jgi:hypothetical protein
MLELKAEDTIISAVELLCRTAPDAAFHVELICLAIVENMTKLARLLKVANA